VIDRSVGSSLLDSSQARQREVDDTLGSLRASPAASLPLASKQ
jgi:hypothetical protein